MLSRKATILAIFRVAKQNPKFRKALLEESMRVEAGRFTTPRPAYLPPEVRGTDPFVPPGTDLAIWSWDSPKSGKPMAIAFAGKADKPLWNYVFNSEAQRQRRIDETIKDRKSLLESKQQRVQERKDFRHSLKKDDILYTSWGYDQTNVEFYQVVDAQEKSVVIRQIAQKEVSSDGDSDRVVAVPNKFVGPPLRKVPQRGNNIRLNNSSAYPWDGKPKHQTGIYAGH